MGLGPPRCLLKKTRMVWRNMDGHKRYERTLTGAQALSIKKLLVFLHKLEVRHVKRFKLLRKEYGEPGSTDKFNVIVEYYDL